MIDIGPRLLPVDEKPISPAELLHIVHEYHGGAPEDRPNAIVGIEDNPDFYFLLGRFLKRTFPGFDIHLFEKAEHALRFMEDREDVRKRLGAVITDINLPGMTGTNLARVLNGVDVGNYVLPAHIVRDFRGKPIILQSDVSPDNDHVKHVRTKRYAHGLIPKTYDAETFRATFREAVAEAILGKTFLLDKE